jgi:hypothetical protein
MRIIALCGLIMLVGCAPAVATHYTWNPQLRHWFFLEGGWEPEERMVCTNAGCKADFEKNTIENGTLLPSIPMKLEN